MRKEKNREVKQIVDDFEKGKIDRRTFLYRIGAIGALAVATPLIYKMITDERDSSVFNNRQWEIVEAVQNHLFPSRKDSPGAKEINARLYLQWVVSDPNMDPEEMQWVINGFDWIEETAFEETNKSFLELGFDEKEKVLRVAEAAGWGENWISKNLLYIFEALLCDPIYGGNENEIGWKWLEHIPGLPRPTEKQRYRA